MPRVAVIHHLDRPFLGHAAGPFAAAGVELVEHDLGRGDPLPDHGAADGLLVLGGDQSVRDIDRFEWMGDEAELLRRSVGDGVPVLGVCLGGQLLAHALGGEVTKMPRRMVAWPEVERLPAAGADPVFGALPARFRVLHWNEDAFTLPEGGTELLSRAGPGVEAFRAGERAWGIQFHPEADSDALEVWYAEGDSWLAEGGVSEEEARAADRRWLGGQTGIATAIFGGFASVVAGNWTNVRGSLSNHLAD